MKKEQKILTDTNILTFEQRQEQIVKEVRFVSTIQLHIQHFLFEFEYLKLYLLRGNISDVYKNRQKDYSKATDIILTREISFDVVRLPNKTNSESQEFTIFKLDSIGITQMIVIE